MNKSVDSSHSKSARGGSLDRALGKCLRARRETMQLTLDEVAGGTGIAADVLANYEAGEQRCSPEHLQVLATMLQVTVPWMFSCLGDEAHGDWRQPQDAPTVASNVIAYPQASRPNREEQELLRLFANIRTPFLRESLLAMARSLAGNDGPSDA